MSNVDPGAILPQEPGRNPPRHVRSEDGMMTGGVLAGLVLAGALILGAVAYTISDDTRMATTTTAPTTTGQGGEVTKAPAPP
jgi:hypothetical protein